jgi:DNA (cytosine-5)-methyltransferase 1
VTGVDIKPQKRYPRNEYMRFVQADAIEYALAYGWQYDAVWASPLCQIHSAMGRIHAKDYKDHHEDFIPLTRWTLESLELPYIIENVEGARAALRNPLMLCGSMFPELRVYRHRLFESNVLLCAPPHHAHDDDTPPAGMGKSSKGFISLTGGGIRGVTQQERFGAMGIDWMSNERLNQAIPPAFSKYLGRQLMQYVQQRSEVVCEHS